MPVVILEDAPDSIYVRFLQCATGYSVEGAGGAGNLRDKAREALNKGADLVYCVVDVPHDNRQAHISYSKLLTFCRKHPSVVPIPIVCVEEFFWRQLHSIGLGHITGKPIAKGVESYFKSLMTRCVPECQQVQSSKLYGKFYDSDCGCCDLYKATVSEKAMRFLHALPLDTSMEEYVAWYNNYTKQALVTV